MPGGIEVEIEGLDDALKLLDEYDQRQLLNRFRRAVTTAVRPLAKAMRSEAPKGATLRLSKSVKVKRLRGGGAKVGPTSPLRFIVVRGTAERQTTQGADRGRMPSNPFVDRAIAREGAGVINRVRTAILAVRK